MLFCAGLVPVVYGPASRPVRVCSIRAVVVAITAVHDASPLGRKIRQYQMNRLSAIQLVALIEATKGFLVLLAGLGGLALLHGNAQELAMDLLRHLHLDPRQPYPHSLLLVAAEVSDTRLWLLAGAASLYATVRGVEAYGLWHARRWAEWFAASSAGVYIPFEVFELLREPGWIVLIVLIANALVLAVMIAALRRRT